MTGLRWVLYCAVVAALLGVAASVAERVLRGVGRQGRWVWAAALLGSLLFPLAAWREWIVGSGWLGRSVRGLVSGWGPRQGAALEIVAPAAPDSAVGAEATVLDTFLSAAGPWLAALSTDRLLLYGWLLSTGAGVAVLVLSSWRLVRARRSWRAAEVDGVRVLVSREVGPAAMGVVRSTIVVPEWALSLEDRFRRLLLLHEAEHLRAGDPRLLLGGLLAVVAMPWNPVLWWQFRRLRQALELDCDDRVLRSEPDARSYGLLLLEVGRRRGPGGLALAGLAGLKGPGLFLERRIRMLGRSSQLGGTARGYARARVLGGVGTAALLILLACEAGAPTVPEETPESLAAVSAESADPKREKLELFEVAKRAQLARVEDQVCTPLYIVDEAVFVPAGGKEAVLSGMDPKAIESIEVVKGMAAMQILPEHTAEDKACGVIRITTKEEAGEGSGIVRVRAPYSVGSLLPAQRSTQ